ncbi:MAG: class I SAM-dependent methyltransferase [Nitrososphaerota archaeon]|nr:class I SAM-dependent methyltransferase [Nitrososphaerota archaeon]MDG7026958.1 class I SAM-dependent methyltransferase [Nitrososphaerota archaeon]
MNESRAVVDFFERRDYTQFWREREIEDAAQKHIIGGWVATGASSIDLGGGFGRIAKILVRSFVSVVLLDLSKRSLGMAKRNLVGVTPTRGDVSKTPFRDSTFDCVVMIRVLHLLPDPSATMQEVYRIAKDGATVIVSIPNQVMIKAFMDLSGLARIGRRKAGPAFIPSIWPYGDKPCLLSPMAIFPSSFKLVGRRGTGIFENPFGRRLRGHRRLYLLDVATSLFWMFKFEIFLNFRIKKVPAGVPSEPTGRTIL